VADFNLTIPLTGLSLARHRDVVTELVELGYTGVSSSESSGVDGFTALAMAAAWAPHLDLVTAVVPAYTRGPAVLAQSFAALAEATSGRVIAGIGASSPAVVRDWNSIPFEQPFQRVRDTIRFLRAALRGEKVTAEYETFSVNGLRLLRPPTVVPKILVAAAREAMLKLSGREADGAIINWISPTDVKVIAGVVQEAAAKAGRPPPEIFGRILVCPSTDTEAEAVRAGARRFLAHYVTPPGYRAFHEWIGRGEELGEVFAKWEAGDRRGAAAAISDNIIDELIVHGTPEACQARIASYVDNGLTTASVALVSFGTDDMSALRRLGPVSGFAPNASDRPSTAPPTQIEVVTT
jgi:probable F420-dependent oxidoreductase